MDMMSLLAADDMPVAIQMGLAPDGAFAAEAMTRPSFDMADVNRSLGPSWTGPAATVANAVSNAQSTAATALRSVGQTLGGSTGADMSIPVTLGLVAVGVFFAVRASQGKKAISFGKKRGSSFKFGK